MAVARAAGYSGKPLWQKLGLASGGMLWFAWPKKASGVATDVTEDGLRELVLPHGWVDVKVCAIDTTWSGLKFLRRKLHQAEA